MFDVRPVDQTGDLDWDKIQSIMTQGIETKKQIKLKESQFEKSVKAYILGVGIENERAPIFHDPEFNLGEFSKFRQAEEITKKDERILKDNILYEEKTRLKKQQEQQRLAKLWEQDRLFKEQEDARQKKEMLLKTQREKIEETLQAELLRKDNQRKIFFETEISRRQKDLKKITEHNRNQQKEYEAAVIEQRKELERQKAQWLKEELEAEKELSRKEKKVFTQAGNYWQDFSWRNLFFPPRFYFQFDMRNSFAAFALVALIMSLAIGSVSYASKGFGLKGKVLGVSQDGFANLTEAVDDMTNQNFESSAKQFSEAYANFSEASAEIEDMGGILLDATRFVPFASRFSSGKNAVEAGKHFSAAGQALNEVVKSLAGLKNPIDASNRSDASLLDIFQSAEKNITDAKKELDAAQQNMDKISVNDLPKDKQDKFLLLKQKLPEIRSALDLFLNNSHIFVELLGGNGPRKYLFLFQNNSEMRATGGFVGSYGLLDIANGHIKKFFIDGIFNPDGQLKEKIVPPQPIQKISAAWSMHDSNWFPDFPTSAKKAIYFYEKTGGPTADGVITFTPTIMQELLEITGPIDMPEYDVTLDSKNFIELTQYKVEVDYDKEDNQPKKILADLAPIVLEKLLASKNIDTISKTINVFLSGLREKHILLYSQGKDLENIISKQGWSGEILPASKDYLSVINTNVNGFKTDAVVQEDIRHNAEIQQDGSVIDTVTITRKHTGGDSKYDWLNKVNADYMRVYVPRGSKLLEVSGQTREVDKPPLDYDALGFKRDDDVQNEESNTTIDSQSGTRVYDEAGKTVFANWVYVSPQETAVITYKYLLPFTLFKVSVGGSQQIDSYSLTAQKQSGSVGSSFISEISYPEKYKMKWNFPDDIEKGANNFKNEMTLTADYFEGVVFEKD